MNNAYEEVLLNELLNEMDGLKEDADILFILTTNRPEALEAALASRPGRVDQAIEFPFPTTRGARNWPDFTRGAYHCTMMWCRPRSRKLRVSVRRSLRN